jgi:THUMP domain-like
MSFQFTEEHIAYFKTDAYKNIRIAIRHEIEKYTDPLRLQTSIRKQFPAMPASLVAACLEQTELAELIDAKTGLGSDLVSTRELLQQASSKSCSQLHAKLLDGHSHILELCPGMGTDTIALAQIASTVTTVEADPLHASILRQNLCACDITNVNVVVSRAETFLRSADLSEFDALFADPSRRKEARRTVDPEEYLPPLSSLRTAVESLASIIKIAPATKVVMGDCRAFIAIGNECKEQLIIANLRGPKTQVISADKEEIWVPGICTEPVVSSWRYLIEAHNAVIASGEVRNYLHELGFIPIDSSIAYGVGEKLPEPSAFFQAFKILEHFPFSLKKLKEAIKSLNFDRRSEIKKRGFPLLPDELRKKLNFCDKGEAGTVIVSRRGNMHYAFLCTRITG